MSFKTPSEMDIKANLKGAMTLYADTAKNAESTQQKRDSELRAVRVWNAMKQMYGSAFLSVYGDEPNSAWKRAIAGLTDEQCKRGLSNLVRAGGDFPATLPKFVEACCLEHSPRFLGTPITPEQHRQSTRIGKVKASPEQAERHLASIREKLSGVPKPAKKEIPPDDEPLLSGAALTREKARQLEALSKRWYGEATDATA